MKLSHKRPTFILSILILALMAATSAIGLLVPGTYRDNATIAAALRGNDLVTLILAVPILAFALVRCHSREQPPIRWLLVWMATLMYSLYNYVFYLYGSAINNCFVAYIALTALSMWALIVGISGLDVERIQGSYSPKVPVRWVAGFMLFFAVFLGSLWVARIVGFMVTGTVPADITQTGRDTGIVYATDLTLLIPTMVVAAVWLWRRRGWGLVLAPITLIKCTAYSLALIAMSPFAKAAGMANAWDLVPLWAALGAGACASSLTLLTSIRRQA